MAHVFPRLVPVNELISNFDWFVVLLASIAVIGKSNCFGFGFTMLSWKLLQENFNMLLHITTVRLNPCELQ